MSDEQTIYIGPEDDLTSVRERLANIQSRRVTLVIPTQTQLRSHVAWKLLHARARELSKDVLIVSSDPQIRSVAQAVKFKVAHSLESSPISRSRPTGRGGRSNPANRGRMSGRGGPRNSRSGGSSRSSGQPQHGSPSDQIVSTGLENIRQRRDETITGGLNEPLSSSIFDLPDKETPLPHDFSQAETTLPPTPRPAPPPVTPMPSIPPMSSIPPIRSLSRDQIDQIEEEPDSLLEDYHMSQDIRRAATNPEAQRVTPPAEPPVESSKKAGTPSRSDQLPHIVDDPFSAMEDDSKPPVRAEQRGAVALEGFEVSAEQRIVPDVAEMPTEVLDQGDIEDMGDDQGILEIPTNDQPITRHDWEEEVNTAGPVREREQQRERREPLTRGSRSGSLKKPRPQDIESEDALPPVEERPSRVVRPPSSPLQKGGAAPVSPARPVAPAANRPGNPVAPARARPGLSRPPQRSARERGGRSRVGTPSRAGRAVAARQRNIAAYVSVIIIVLILLLVGALAYFVPSAQVRVTLPSRDYSHVVNLKAAPKGQQVAAGSVVGDVLTRDFTKSGVGNATGTAKINNQSAIGSVLFTNNGTIPVTIPTGTIVATAGANGQQFATTATAVVSPKGNVVGNTTEVPIQAAKPGPAGNVAKGAITVIPDDSLNQIAKATGSVSVADLKLSVSNDATTTGGGAGNATVVTRKDLDNTTKNLQNNLKGDIDAWVKQQKVDAQDIVGQPQITGSLVKPPAEGTVENNGTFPAQLSATVTLMIIRHAALQDATIQQLDGFLAKDKAFVNTDYTILQDARQPVQIQKLKQSGQGTALTLNFTALARAIPRLTADQVQRSIAGKQIPDAIRQLKGLKPKGVSIVEDVTIQTSPGFVPWVTSWTRNINVEFVAGTPPAPSKK